MPPMDPIDSSNPFALHSVSRPKLNRRPLWNALKYLAAVVVCFVLVIAFTNLSQRWLLNSLTADLDSLSAMEQKSRLERISQFGSAGIPPLVGAMTLPDFDAARRAYDLLGEAQNGWTVLSVSQQCDRHNSLVQSLDSIALELPEDRTGWATSLIQQTLLMAVSRKDQASSQVYRRANETMERLSLSQRPDLVATDEALKNEVLDPNAPQRLAIRAEPLPVAALDSVGQWTVSPPPTIHRQSESQPDVIETVAAPPAPTVYRSTASRLQPVRPNESVILNDVAHPTETAYHLDPIQSVAHLTNSPMEAFNDRSVMHWLTSPHQKLREQAKLELISRGYTDTELSIGTRLVSSDIQSRLEIVDKISRDSTIDPRPWLWMLTEDENRSVRLRVISVLATMNDPEMDRRFHAMLTSERDPIVAARLRRVLDLR